MHTRYSPFLFIIFLFLSACTTFTSVDRLSFMEDHQAKRLLEKAIAGSGGWEAWEQQQRFAFQKDYSLYLENGKVESAAVQQHEYNFGEPLSVNIAWEADKDKHTITFAKGEAIKWKNGLRDSSYAAQRAMNTVLSSTFVMRLPYNLVDPTAKMSYDGIKKITMGDREYTVETLIVTYDPTKHENHSTPDTWWLNFDKNTGALLSYEVQHADHISGVENLSTQQVDGLLMPLERKSYRLNSDGSRQYLRAAYKYSYEPAQSAAK